MRSIVLVLIALAGSAVAQEQSVLVTPAPVASKMTEKEMVLMRSKVKNDQDIACFFLQRAAHALKLSGVGVRDPRVLEIMALLSTAEAQLRDTAQQQPLARGR